jgi:uncharacterized membrane protein (DUF4010 family)
LTLARILAGPLVGLALVGFVICALQYWWGKSPEETKISAAMLPSSSKNPLEVVPAAVFAGLFIATSLASSFATSEFGTSGIYALAAIIGVSDIDPFVLNLVQGGTTGVTNTVAAAAILIAASSNNILKAFYAVSFGGGTTAPSAAALVFLAVAGAGVGVAMAFGLF